MIDNENPISLSVLNENVVSMTHQIQRSSLVLTEIVQAAINEQRSVQTALRDTNRLLEGMRHQQEEYKF